MRQFALFFAFFIVEKRINLHCLPGIFAPGAARQVLKL
jgi:hypothetical protein